MAGAQRLPALLALAVGALAGDVFVLLVNRLPLPAEAHLDPWGDTLPYSYRDPNCTIPADPITVVFYYNATIPNMHTHAHHHGGWSYHDGDTQYFLAVAPMMAKTRATLAGTRAGDTTCGTGGGLTRTGEHTPWPRHITRI
jgi:hypothetical protein